MPDEAVVGYSEIPQLQDAQKTLHDFAAFAVEDILKYPDTDVIVPLNGSVLPLYYAYEYILNHYPDHVESFTRRLFYMRDVKDEDGNITDIYFDKNTANTCGLYLFDDIADELHVVRALSGMCKSIVIHAPVEKRHTGDYLAQMPKPVALNTHVTTENEWIANTCGMDEGAKEGTVYQQAYLSTLQRFSRKGYFKELDNTMSVEEKIAFFEGLLLPEFRVEDPLFQRCLEMEMAKIERRHDDLMILAQDIVPLIVQKLQERRTYEENPLTA